MRNSDDHTIKHRRMTEHNLLDLPGKHVEAARDDHVPLAVDDIDVTVCVTPAEVAAELPAIAADGRGCVRVLVKLRHLHCRAEGDLTHLVIGRDLACFGNDLGSGERRSEEHTSELQSLMRISYAVFCLKKKKNISLKTD